MTKAWDDMTDRERDFDEAMRLHSRDEGSISATNRYVIKTNIGGHRFLLGYVPDKEYMPLPGDVYFPDFGLGVFVPDIQWAIESGELAEGGRVVPYRATISITEITEDDTDHAPPT